MSDSSVDVDGEQVRVSFILAKNQDRSLEVPSDPIAVPSSTRKKGLSAIINHLLDRRVDNKDGSDEDSDSDDEDKEPAIPFDFLVNHKLLRMSVEAMARREALSLEQAIEIEYFPAREAPEGEGESESQPDWISSLASTESFVVSGICDGSLRLFDQSDAFQQVGYVKAHAGPVQCVSSVEMEGNDKLLIASGSMDQTLLMHMVNKKNQVNLHAVCSGGHMSSVSSTKLLSTGSDTASLASGDWDGGLCVWNVPTSSNDSSESSSKKRKGVASQNVQEVTPQFFLKAHASNISGIVGAYQNSNVLLTSSWDHSIKSWDVESQNNILTLNGAKVATCIGRCHNSDVVATGHPDCTVRLWDMRSNTKNEGNLFYGSLRPR